MGKKQKVVRKGGNYPPAFRLEVVKLHLDEGYSIVMLAEEFGCAKSTIGKWLKAYNAYGEAGLLQPATRRKPKVKTSDRGLKSKIIELKKADPQRGIRRISDILRRFFLVKASPESVRATLHEAKLIEPPPKKRRRNISKPRRFERATPNQMWQTDICTFHSAGI
jgi:transposase